MSGVRFTVNTKYYGFPVHTFSLPAGYSCPGAKACETYASQDDGKLMHGEQQTFRCYAASGERYPLVRQLLWANWDALRSAGDGYEQRKLLLEALPAKSLHVRIHQGGDFYSQEYFDAWLAVCRVRPLTCFWAFTKSLPFWVKRLGEIPPNLVLTASHGGHFDYLIKGNRLKYARVVASEEEATMLGLEIDTDDRLAREPDTCFALLEKAALRRRKRAA